MLFVSLFPFFRTSGNRDRYFLVGQHKLSLKDIKSPTEGWCSSLLWLPTPSSSSLSTPPSSSHSPPPLPPSPSYFSFSNDSAHGQLLVGCTNGQVACLRLRWRGVAALDENSCAGCYSSFMTVVRRVGDTELTVCVNKATPLWEESDSVPVYCMSCHSRVSVLVPLHLLFVRTFHFDLLIS